MSNIVFMKILLLVMVVLLSACVTAPEAEQWPEEMPPRSYFTNIYAEDKPHQKMLSEQGYLTWVYRFYNGWELYSRGWLQAIDEMADSLETPNDKAQSRVLMEEIGLLIAPDWAKSDPYRSITVRHVALWGNVILQSMVDGEQFPMLYNIREDVQQMLAGNLDPDNVTKSRYVTEEAFIADGDLDF